jgi:hypothetical protein
VIAHAPQTSYERRSAKKNGVNKSKRAVRAVHGALAGVLILSVLFSPLHGIAQSQHLNLTVSATVLRRASLQVLAQPSAVTITAADIERGYVDVPTSARLAVRSNSPDGFMFEFVNQGEFVRGLRVRGLGAELQMGPQGGFVRHMSGPVRSQVVDLTFRIELSSAARPGVYAWPVRMAITAL